MESLTPPLVVPAGALWRRLTISASRQVTEGVDTADSTAGQNLKTAHRPTALQACEESCALATLSIVSAVATA